MENPLKLTRWSPYVVGVGIGVLSWITFGLMGKALGTSTTMVRAVGVIEGYASEEHVRNTEYLAKYVVGKPAFEWQFALVIALFIGALFASKLSKSTPIEHVPSLWAWRFGNSRARRYTAAFLGGAILLFGARMAGGCTSGHSISGGIQLALSSWLFTGALFISGIVTAFLLFGREGRHHV